MTGLTLKIGTRQSPLALLQAQQVQEAFLKLDIQASLVPLKTTGDLVLDKPLYEIGGKGLFTKELDRALLSGEIDLAVHSAKDVPPLLPTGLVMLGVPFFEDSGDVFFAQKNFRLESLPQNAILGTTSVRRQALVKRMRPDLTFVPLRGNVGTRLRALEDGKVDALILAAAGLKRLGIPFEDSQVLPAETFPPALGQGYLLLTGRDHDMAVRDVVSSLILKDKTRELVALRAFAAGFGGSCTTPLAGFARAEDTGVLLEAYFISPCGKHLFDTALTGEVESDFFRLGESLRDDIPPSVLAQVYG